PSERELVDEFLAEQALFQRSLSERALGRKLHSHVTTDPGVWYNYRLLQVWDRLSIQFGFRLAADGEIAPLPRPNGPDAALRIQHLGEMSVRLDPYPFEDSPRVFPLKARLVPDKAYRMTAELLAAIASAPLTGLDVRAE